MLHMLTRNHFDLFLSSKIVESSLRTRSRGRQAAAGGNVLTVLLVYISDKVKMCEPCYWSLYFRFIPQICRPNKSQQHLLSPVQTEGGIHSLIRITQATIQKIFNVVTQSKYSLHKTSLQFLFVLHQSINERRSRHASILLTYSFLPLCPCTRDVGELQLVQNYPIRKVFYCVG